MLALFFTSTLQRINYFSRVEINNMDLLDLPPIPEHREQEEIPQDFQEPAEGVFHFREWLQSCLEQHEEEPKRAEQIRELNSGKDGFLRTLTEVSEIHGKKRMFVCCDGTWLNASGTVAPLSNVAKLARSVNRVGEDDPSFETIGGVPQLVYYSSGVGTRSSLGMDSNVAAATGKGILLVPSTSSPILL